MTKIEWEKHDGGFEPGVYNGKRAVKRPNAQVSAFAIYSSHVTGSPVSYKDAFYTLTIAMEVWANRPGRASSKRQWWRDNPTATLHSYRMPKEFYRPYIDHRLPVRWVGVNSIGTDRKLHLEGGVFSTDDMVLVRASGDELIPVIEGVAHYPWDPNQRWGRTGTRMVYGFWTTG